MLLRERPWPRCCLSPQLLAFTVSAACLSAARVAAVVAALHRGKSLADWFGAIDVSAQLVSIYNSCARVK